MALTKIKADGLTADLIDETKLADNSIDSEHYNDGSIDNAHLADDAVGIAELSATGTASSSTFLRGDNSWTAVNTDLVSDTSPQLGGALDTNGSNINFGDSTTNGTTVNRLTFGTATNGDLALWHDGNNSYIVDQGTGELRIRGAEVVKIQDTDSAENMGVFNKNGSVELYYDDSKRLETDANGVKVIGNGSAAELEIRHDASTYKGSIYSNNLGVGLLDSSGNWAIQHASDTATTFSISNASKARIDADGLKFGSDTASANALDDYEEGTWTPTSNVGSITVSTAHYVKIGSLVMAQAYVTFPSMSGSSEVLLQGYPFTTANSTDYHSAAVNSDANLNTQLCGQFVSTTMKFATENNTKANINQMSSKFVVVSVVYTTH